MKKTTIILSAIIFLSFSFLQFYTFHKINQLEIKNKALELTSQTTLSGLNTTAVFIDKASNGQFAEYLKSLPK